MYLLDTNVMSELRKPAVRRNLGVTDWIRSIDVRETYISAITLYELELGVRRKERKDPAQGELLRAWLDGAVRPQFENRILSFDERVALEAARLHVPDQQPLADSFIAATALVHGFSLVTRNIKDFKAMGVKLINPFAEN